MFNELNPDKADARYMTAQREPHTGATATQYTAHSVSNDERAVADGEMLHAAPQTRDRNASTSTSTSCRGNTFVGQGAAERALAPSHSIHRDVRALQGSEAPVASYADYK